MLEVESKNNSLVTLHVNEFTDASAKIFYEEFEKAYVKEQPVVPVIINSYGGQVDSLLVMIDTILSYQAHIGQVATVCLGKAMSCGSILLGFGSIGHRYCAPNARGMIHQFRSGAWGPVCSIETSAAETRHLNNRVYKLLAKHCKQPNNFYLDLIDNNKNEDIYLTPEQLKGLKLVDELKVPHFSLQQTSEVLINF